MVDVEDGFLPENDVPIQTRIARWVDSTLGQENKEAGLTPLQNKQERCLRFVEEAIELGQACGLTRGVVHRLVDYVYNRFIGKVPQEIAGSMLTLYCVAAAYDIDADAVLREEVERVETPEIREKVRKRQSEKREGLVSPHILSRASVAAFAMQETFKERGDPAFEVTLSRAELCRILENALELAEGVYLPVSKEGSA